VQETGNVHRIAWWDETHKKCRIGGQAGSAKKTQVTFPRNERGELDIVGTIEPSSACKLNVKFENEICLLLGCAMPKNEDGEVVGLMLKPFSYSGKTVVTNKGYRVRKYMEIAHVKTLPKGGPFWITSNRKNTLYREESITKVFGIAAKTYNRYFRPHNIHTVGDLMEYQEDPQALAALIKISVGRVVNFLADAISKSPNDDPLPATSKMDHRTAENPYLSKYGSTWEDEIKKGTHVREFVNIQEVVEHIYLISRELFNPTSDPLKDDCFFYHDALLLMVCSETKNWMEGEGYLKHWVLPECGLQTGDLKEYDGRPIGNMPEMQPLDCTLNKDGHDGVQSHCAATAHIPDDDSDPRTFSISTPARGNRAYFRVLEGLPSSDRIIQDCMRWVPNMREISLAKGAIVPGIGNRQGCHFDQAPGKRGGKRVRMNDEDFVV
jgi:hypothetical protein